MLIYDELISFLKKKRGEMKAKFNRHVSIQDLLSDRWETAQFNGFGQGSSCYNNVLILGDVEVGEHVWIGPNVILDGSGGLKIGDYVSISAGVHIYSHHTVKWATSMGKEEVEKRATSIGSGVFIGPNSVIQMGVDVGDRAVIGAMSFVNKDIPAEGKWLGTHLKTT
ncbi:acyltransferase [Magnetococcus sp. PR-3]|uniref:acyltransferase n=1 Tax=Magnetococcus sp. PR-3 TaxID=3120355 RepID=UPI002FCE4954